MHMIKKEPIFYLYWLNATFVLIKDKQIKYIILGLYYLQFFYQILNKINYGNKYIYC